MFHRLIFRLAGLLVFAAAANAQQFTADMLRLKPTSDVATKLFVSGVQVRFEATNQDHTSVVLLNLAEHTSTMLVPAAKTYYVSPQGRTPAAMPFFLPDDADNACDAFEKATSKPGTCTKVGAETIQGRIAVKYKGTAQNGETGYAWVDRQLKFVIKWEGENTSTELQNIKEGPQASNLFEVPSDYAKFDLHQAKQNSRAKKAAPMAMPPH